MTHSTANYHELNPSLERPRTSRSSGTEFVALSRLVRDAQFGRYLQ
jgi:hypothetical protein